MTDFAPLHSTTDLPPVTRSIHLPALLKSLAVLVALVVAAFAWHRLSLHRNSQALRDYAEQCAADGDFSAAAAQFARYLDFRPDDAMARVRLAQTYDLAYSKTGRVERTIELYREALGLATDEQKPPIRIRLGELLLEVQQYLPAAEEARAVVGHDPQNARAATLLARAQYGQARQGAFQGNPEIVGASLEKALALDPGERTTALILARIYREEPRFLSAAVQARPAAEREKTADEIVDRLLAAHPQDPEIRLVRYRYRRQYRLTGAEHDLEEARGLGPQNLEVLLASGEGARGEAAAKTSPNAAQARSLREAARGYYEKAAAAAGSDYRGYLGLGETESELGENQAAIETWKRGLQSAPAAAKTFNVLLASALVGTGQLEDAAKYLDQVARDLEATAGTERSPQRTLLARKYKLIRARWLRGKGQPLDAIELARAVATGPSVTQEERSLVMEAWALVADSHVALGRWVEAAEACERLAELAPRTPTYQVMGAAAWMEANRPDRAVRSLRLALPYGDGSELRLALAGAIFRQNAAAPKDKCDWQAVEAALNDARHAHAKQPLPEPWRLGLLEAEIAAARADAAGRHAAGVREAAAIYGNIALDAKTGKTLLPTIAMALERLGLHDDADAKMRRWEGLVGDDPAAIAVRVRWLHVRGRNGEVGPLVEAAARRLVKASAVSPEEKARQFKSIGDLYELAEQYAAAERWYRRLLETRPESFEPLALSLARQHRGGEAVGVCLEAARRTPPSGPALLACSLRANSEIDDKDLQAAEPLIAAAEKDSPSPEFLKALAAVRALQDKADEAISLYRRVLAAAPQDIRTMNNLATLMGERPGQFKEALALVNRAVEIAGPQGWLLETKGQALLRGGRVDEAIAVLQGAADSSPPDPRLLLHLAQAYCLAGKLEKARTAFADARRQDLSQQVLTPADRKLIKELEGGVAKLE